MDLITSKPSQSTCISKAFPLCLSDSNSLL